MSWQIWYNVVVSISFVFFENKKECLPHAYLVQLRLEHAGMMLDKRESIADAALSSGFSDQSHLTRKFKLRFGVTPGVDEKQRLFR
jgi:AraC-like DNA-binding protein